MSLAFEIAPNVARPLKSLQVRPPANPRTFSSREFRAVCLAISKTQFGETFVRKSCVAQVEFREDGGCTSAADGIVRTVINSSEPYTMQKWQSSFPRRGYGYQPGASESSSAAPGCGSRNCGCPEGARERNDRDSGKNLCGNCVSPVPLPLQATP